MLGTRLEPTDHRGTEVHRELGAVARDPHHRLEQDELEGHHTARGPLEPGAKTQGGTVFRQVAAGEADRNAKALAERNRVRERSFGKHVAHAAVLTFEVCVSEA